jgi:hypothetical protein
MIASADSRAAFGLSALFKGPLRPDAGRVQADHASWAAPLPNTGVLLVLLISGLCGAYLGTPQTLQNAVESAQVLAGKVIYPADNPFYLYHIKAWTLMNQVPALMLHWGMSERAASMLLGAVIGMVGFQAIALCVYVLCRNPWLALAVPLIVEMSGLYDEIHNRYAIRFFSHKAWQCYGVMGTSWVALCWALYAAGKRRAAAVLAGLAPAIHVTLGLWCLAVAFCTLVLFRRRIDVNWRSTFLWLGVGFAITLISFGIGQYQARHVPTVDPETREAYTDGWDTHRRPARLLAPAGYYGLCALLLSAVWLRWFRRELSPGGTFMMGTMLVSSVVGLALMVSTHFQDYLPTPIVMAMPVRYINITCFLLPAVVFGLLARRSSDTVTLAVLVGCCYLLILRKYYIELELFYIPDCWYPMAWGTLFLLGSAWRWAGYDDQGQPSKAPRGLLILRWVSAAAMVAVSGIYGRGRKTVLALFAGGGGLIALPEKLRGWCELGIWRVVLLLCLAGGCVSAAVVVMDYPMATAMTVATAAILLLQHAPTLRLPVIRTSTARWALGSGMLAVAAMSSVLLAHSDVSKKYCSIYDCESNPMLKHIEEGEGMILTASSIRLIQLRARRPVILEGAALNQLPYVPESGPSMNHILNRLYGEDLLKPRPPSWKMERGGLMTSTGRKLWEQRTPEEWRRLANEFGFTQIVTYKKWKLQLPVAYRSRGLVLYNVPGAKVENYHRLVEQTHGSAVTKVSTR